MLNGPVPRSWPRFLRLSVRGLIVLVLLIGGGLGRWLYTARVQRDAVASLKGLGWAEYDAAWTGGNFASRRDEPWTGPWLANLVGIDYCAHVTKVSLTARSKVTDAAIAPVERLNRLEHLGLSESSVSDAGLMHLKGLINLAELKLDGTPVSGAGLANLAGLTNLAYLSLRGTQVSDAGLVHLKGLTHLYFLGLGNTRVTDAGLVHLNEMTSLPELDLSHTHVTDAGLSHQ